MNIGFPFGFDAHGRTRLADLETHVREMVEQVLFTAPGERVHRPDFGTGLRQLVFEPNSPGLASATQLLVQSALQHWLGELIQVDDVTVESDEASLKVMVRYTSRHDQQQRVARLQRGLES